MRCLAALAGVLVLVFLAPSLAGSYGPGPSLGSGGMPAKGATVEPLLPGSRWSVTGPPQMFEFVRQNAVQTYSSLLLVRQNAVQNGKPELRQGRGLGWWVARARFNRRGWNKANRTLAQRHHPVAYALKLASVVYGVPEGEMSRVAWCESRHLASASNGQYRGIFQEGPMFERGPFGRAGFSVWDPVANALTAAYTVSREGWRQWACRP